MKEAGASILDLLVEHEAALKRLYQAYAATLGDSRDLWQTLAGDEQRHADSLDELRDEPALDGWISQEGRLKPQAVRSSIDYVETQISRAREGGLGLMQALAVAKDLEDALIDRLSLLPDSSGCTEIETVLGVLKADTERHRRLIADALETERKLGPRQV